MELAVVNLPEGDSITGSRWRQGAWRTVSVGGNLRPTLTKSETYRIRGQAGLSVHRTVVPGIRNPYGTVPGAHVGVSVEHRFSRAILGIDTGLNVVFSDFGVHELDFAAFTPVTIGISW